MFAYQILTNEAYRKGLGVFSENSSFYDNVYKPEKDRLTGFAAAMPDFDGIDFDQEYGSNNFAGVANIMDQMLVPAVVNMNGSKGLDLQAKDMRQFMNLALSMHSLRGLHDVSKNLLKHTNCVMQLRDTYAMQQAYNEMLLQDKNQNQDQNQNQNQNQGPDHGLGF